ncbi:MAG TPA: glycosyltransferase [Solimonas sp.]
MKITISTFGTRGDIEPPLALAVGLCARGHEVTLVAPEASRTWVQSHGVRWAPLRFDFGAVMYRDDLLALMQRKRYFRYLRELQRAVQRGSRESLDDLFDASRDADFIVQSGFGHGGVEIAAHRDIPMAFLYPFPMAATRAFPSFWGGPRLPLGGGYNRMTHAIARHVAWRTYGPPLNAWRRERFGWPPWKSYTHMLASGEARGAPNLLAFSPAFLPKPDDWNDHQHITGFLALPTPADWVPPSPLRAFLADGPPPVYVGFGSMRVRDPVRHTREVLRALALAGQRGILLVGGGGCLTRMPASDRVLFIDEAPFHWLLPRVAAAVIHGGAGTTHTVLHAGIPAVVLPHVFDQPSWAAQVAASGVGVNGASLRGVKAESLAAAIRTVIDDQGRRGRAARLGARMRAENGAERAAVLIERYAAAYPHLRAGHG